MNYLRYIKDNGEVSVRNVEPIGFIFDDKNKIMCLDLTKFEGDELLRMQKLAKQLHRDFLTKLYDSELSGSIRTFFLDNIEVL